MPCDPNTLANDARCFCLSAEQHMWVQTYLLAVLAGGSTDPATLTEQSKSFRGIDPLALQWVKTYLLCQISGG